jgi:hypothetical protein
MSTTTKEGLFDALGGLTAEIGQEKQAAHDKSAAPEPNDPGGYQGPSSHPTTSIDNRGQTASEGSRSSENESDVKSDQGSPGVNSTSEATPGQDEQDKQQYNIGTNQSATGEDPSVENDFKGTKDDSGYDSDTSHPTKADKDREKYSSYTFKEAADHACNLMNDILADLVAGKPLQKFAEDDSEEEEEEDDDDSVTIEIEKESSALNKNIAAAQAAINNGGTTKEAFDAGYELAANLGITKEAAVHGVEDCLAQTFRDAQLKADLVGGFILQKQAEYEAYQKAAMEEGVPPTDEEGMMEGEGGPAGEDGGGEGLDAALGGGMPPEMGGMGEDPMGGMGEDPMGGLGEDPMGGGPASEEEAMAELAAALDELGIPIEALAGAGGEGEKLAQAVGAYKRAGLYQIKEASTKRARHIRDLMKGHVQEILKIPQ